MTGNASYLSKAKFPVAFFVNGIGDAFMLLPTLRALANCYHGKLILLCDKSFEQWWFKELNLKAIVGITVNRSKTNFPIIYQSEILEILKGCDVFFSLIFWRSRNLLNLIKKLNNNHIITVGAFDEYKLVVKNMQDLHVIDASFEFAHMVNKSLDVKEYSYPLILSNESAQIAKGLKKNFFLIQKILIVHADTKKNKMWSCNNFSRVINKFLKKHREFVALIVGFTPLKLEQGSEKSRIISCCNLSLETRCAIISYGDLFIGVDSCMLHMADLHRVPGVGLFGPTNSKKFGFRFSSHIHVIGRDSKMNTIRWQTVLKALETVWGGAG